MGEKLTTQRATKVAAGGFPKVVGRLRTIELASAFYDFDFIWCQAVKLIHKHVYLAIQCGAFVGVKSLSLSLCSRASCGLVVSISTVIFEIDEVNVPIR